MNLTFVNLYMMHLSLAPLFIGKRSLTLSNCGFSRFFSSIVFNSWGRVSHTTFKYGLASAIYINSADYGGSKYHISNDTEKWECVGLNFKGFTGQEAALLIRSPNKAITLKAIGVTDCVMGGESSSPIIVEAKSLSASQICIFDSFGKRTKGMQVNTSAKTEVSFLTLYSPGLRSRSSFSSSSSIEVIAVPFSITTSNVSSVDQESLDSSVSFTLQDRDGTSQLQDICVLDCHGVNGFVYRSHGGPNAIFKALNFINNQLNSSIMSFDGGCVIENSYFINNTDRQGKRACIITNDGPSPVTFQNCIIDDPEPRTIGSFSFTGGISASMVTATSEFYGLNTMGCVAPVRPDFKGFFENFTTEEIISNIVCAFGLVIAIVEVAHYFLGKLWCHKDGQDGSELQELSGGSSS